ncbi:MAG: hypothetical protein JOZ90_10930 [Alphaproteobacteria bacterium]|nr:hypothetical protein [Alphaproteobacteria bacterium]MBV9371027.1 hypothetical protein [Alphaproteobacteria bacterium]MBV9901599.1 hypothetical protein [Alphaproteobacteria bacterium]
MSEVLEDAGFDDWPEPTMPQDISVGLRGFASEDGAREFGHAVLGAVRTISGLIDLERLDGITIGFDYDEALASVDRGKEGLRPLSRSDGEVIGIAMSPAVLRDGVVKVHLVFSADYIAGILDGEATDAFRFALAVIAHECAHVEVTKQRDIAFPDTVLQAHYEGYEAELFGQIADICWEEYAACRIAAPFSSGKSDDYTAGLESVLAVAEDRANEAIRAYRSHGNIDRVVNEAGTSLCQPLKIASYLLGHMDGVGIDWSELAAMRELVVSSGYAELIDDLRDELRLLWEGRDSWETLAEFDMLRDVVRDCFESGGLFFSGRPDGTAHVAIPFTAETMPV